MQNKILVSLFFLFLSFSCEKEKIVSPTVYDCNLSFPNDGASHPRASQFSDVLQSYSLKTPGLQIAITSQNGDSWTDANGWADIPSNVPFMSCTKTMIGSTSKVVTAVMIFQLQDEGILSIDDQISKWLDQDLIDQIANADQVTIKQLLNHTTGIPDYLSVRQHINAINEPFLLETQKEKLSYIFDKPATHSPGETYAYSNSNYVLLGLIIESARKMPLWDAIDLYIAQPLGLENFKMGTYETPIPPEAARPYLATHANKYFDAMHMAVSDAATGDGGIASNMQDVNAFFRALFNLQIISEAALKQMTEDLITQGGGASIEIEGFGEELYGLGIERYDTPYGMAFGHAGFTTSYECYVMHFTEKNVTISTAYNGASMQDKNTEQRYSLLWELVQIELD